MSKIARRSLSYLMVGGLLWSGAAHGKSETCALAPYTVKLQRGKKIVAVALPAKGSLVEESHYMTTHDKLPDVWPGAMAKQPKGEHAVQCDEGIVAHLERSIALYRRFKPEATIADVYPEWWQQVWTPQEGGYCGQGSIGEVQLKTLTPEMELWLLTMNWAPDTKPDPGTRFLLGYKGKHVILAAGFETGPRQRKFLGGVTPEVHNYLGVMNETKGLSLGYLQDQTLAPGPVECG